ncbi:MAG: hypothetical protein ACRYHQ_16110 [Janthinobacterium lividum]
MSPLEYEAACAGVSARQHDGAPLWTAIVEHGDGSGGTSDFGPYDDQDGALRAGIAKVAELGLT